MLNGSKAASLRLLPHHIPPGSSVSLVVDAMRVHHYSPTLLCLILCHHSHAELLLQEAVATLLGVERLTVHVRPVAVPYPAMHLASLGEASRRAAGSLFEVRLRVMDVQSVARCQDGEGDDDADRARATQLARVCLAHSTPGAREETHCATLRISGDLLHLYQARHVGETIHVVGRVEFMLRSDAPTAVTRVLHAVFVRPGSPVDPAPVPPPRVQGISGWQGVLSLCNMLRDPALSETGSTEYFRLALVLSSVISQSTATTFPVHLLAFGNVLQDADRMMRATMRTCVASSFTPPTLHQTLHGALGLTARGVCRLLDLGDIAAHQTVLLNKLVEFLSDSHAAACGTLWATLPQFRRHNGDNTSPLDKEFPVLAKSGLARCFSLVHRCDTPSEKSIDEYQRQREQFADKFDPETMRSAVHAAVRLLDRAPISATQSATRLLEAFVQVSRKLRNTVTAEVSIHAVGVAFVLARAHAAFCGRSEVIDEDATVAIYMLEESLLARTGKSILSFSSSLGAGKSNLSMYGPSLHEFYKHVKRLIDSHSAPVEEE